MTTIHVDDFENNKSEDWDGNYADLDPDALFDLALGGDQGAIAHINAQDKGNEEGERHGGLGHSRVQSGHIKGDLHRRRQADKAMANADADEVEQPFTEAMKALFARQEKATLSRLKGTRGRRMMRAPEGKRAAPQGSDPEPADISPNTEPPPPPISAAVVFDPTFWAAQTAAAAAPLYGKARDLAAVRVKTQVTRGQPAREIDDRGSLGQVTNILKARANKMASDVTATTYNHIQDQLVQGYDNGEGIPELAKRVQQVFATASGSRAQTIARTETIGSMNQAATTYAQNLPPGIVGRKEWLCVAAGTRVASAQPVEVVERRRSAGWLTTLRTDAGRVLSVTPNHPVLTSQGWVAAHLLDVGDNLVTAVGSDAVRMEGRRTDTLRDRGDPDIEHAPAMIDEVFRAASQNSPSGRMVTTVQDLYSDPIDCEVEVVPLNGDLRANMQASAHEIASDNVLVLTDVQLTFLIEVGTPSQEGRRPGVLAPEPALGVGTLAVPGQFQLRVTGGDHAAGIGVAAQGDTLLAEPELEDIGREAQSNSYRSDGLASQVVLDRLVEVETVWVASRHEVYDLVTEQGWFIAEGIIVHNSHHDERTRPTHRIADGQQVPLAQPYHVGGSLMMFPGDPTGPPDEVIGCRCSQAFLPPDHSGHTAL